MVRPGYKQTEVGEVPEDWDVAEIGDLLNGFQNGYAFSGKGYVRDGVPIITMAQISLEGTFQFSYEKINYWTNSDYEVLKSFHVKSGDVIIAMTDVTPQKNLIGRMVVVRLDNVALLNQRVGLLKMNLDLVNPIFLTAYSNQRKWRDYSRSIASLGVQANIATGDIKKGKIPLPSIAEQKAIAKALSDVDELIVSLEKLIAKKRDIKTATMQQLLTGKKRLPGFGEGKGYKQTELGEIPEDWDVKSIGSLSKITRGASPRPIDSPIWFDRNSTVGWLRISDVTRTKKYLYETTQNLSEKGILNSRPVSSGSLVMSICATVGRPILTCKDVCIHDGFVVFSNLSVSMEFLYYVLTDIENKWSKHGQTGSQMNLNTNLINSTGVRLPDSVEEQEAIAQILSDLDNELNALELRLNKIKAIKQGMMQELLTGRTRLVDVAETKKTKAA